MDIAVGEVDRRQCDCLMMHYYAELGTQPFSYDPERKAFFLNSGLHVHFCIFCGGGLPPTVTAPKSSRESVQPNEAELAAVNELLSRCTAIEDLIRHLGKPDYQLNATEDVDEKRHRRACRVLSQKFPDIFYDRPELHWMRRVIFMRHWKSLYLEAIEYRNKQFEYSIVGINPGEYPIFSTAPWWQRIASRLVKM